ncbi:MAG: cytochrome c oxidase assembly protein [Thermoleophilia bacterium]|nr:cytochrome c oxidase assembly protein [Thermoleophilia bacterium]
MRPEPFAWSLHLDATLPLALLAVAYALALRRYPATRARTAAFAGGLALLLATAVTPLYPLTFHLLSAHLLQNVVLAEWAPALLVLGVPPALAADLARFAPVRALTHPLVALPLWLVSYFVWHLPPAYDAALRHPDTLLHLEHASYLVTGLLLWWPVLQDEPHRLRAQQRSLYVAAAFLLSSPIGLLLALLPDAVYEWYRDGFAEWEVSALTDQRAAGVTMAGEQAIVFFAVFSYWFFRFLGDEEQEADDAVAA